MQMTELRERLYQLLPEGILLLLAALVRMDWVYFLLYAAILLACGLLIKPCILRYVTNYTDKRLPLGMAAFFIALFELGCLFQIYISRSVKWALPLGMMLLLLLCAALWQRIGRRLPAPLRHFYAEHPAACYLLASGGTALATMLSLVPAGMLSLSWRIRLVELSKLLLMLCLTAIKNPPDAVGALDKSAVRTVCTLTERCGMVVMCGIYALLLDRCGEHGTMLIVVFMLTFYVLVTHSWQMSAFLLSFEGIAYNLLMLLPHDRTIYRRFFDLESFQQVREMRHYLAASYLIPYHIDGYRISMTGTLATRCEDFSYFNCVTVLGRLPALAILCGYVGLLGAAILRILRGNAPRVLRFMALLSCLFLLGNGITHVMANLTFGFFTGVTMPFLSDGVSNLTVSFIQLLIIVRALCSEEAAA